MESTRMISHVRSFSWHVESRHPNSSITDLFSRLRDLEVGPSSTSASSICHNLCDIKDLYQAINKSVQCPLSEQVLSLDKHRCGVEDVLEGSLELLDGCGSTIDVLCLIKESILELESSLRRKSGGEEKGIGAYMLSRKKMQKMANKCLKNLQSINVSLRKDDDQLVSVLRMLSEAQSICLSTLKSIVARLSVAKAKGKGHSLVAKLMHPKRVSCERLAEANEIEMVDQTLSAIEAKKTVMNAEMNYTLLKQLEAVELAVEEIKDCLESVSRSLLKTRVSLLNILSH